MVVVIWLSNREAIPSRFLQRTFGGRKKEELMDVASIERPAPHPAQARRLTPP